MRVVPQKNVGQLNQGCFFEKGRWFTQEFLDGFGDATTRAVTANRLYAMPVFIGNKVVVDRLGCFCSTAQSSGKARVGVYESNPSRIIPHQLLVGSDELDCSTTGFKEHILTTPLGLRGGKVYWLGFVASHGISVRAARGLDAILGYHLSSNTPYPVACIYGSHTFGALPSSFPTITQLGSELTENARAPVVYFKTAPVDPLTKVLLHMNGDNDALSFIDSAGQGRGIWGRANECKITTASSKFGGASGYFAPTPTKGHIYYVAHSDFNMGSGDFTIDFWVRRNDQDVIRYVMGQADASLTASSVSYLVFFNANNTVSFRVASGSSTYTATSTGTVGMSWTHIACVREGSTLKIYIGGTQDGSASVGSASVNSATDALHWGRGGLYDSNTFNGYLDECRLSKGIARWTSNFTPPSQEYL